MSGVRSRYASGLPSRVPPVQSGVLGGYVSVDGKQRQVEYSGLGYLCTLVGGFLLFVLGVLGAIAFGMVLGANHHLTDVKSSIAEIEGMLANCEGSVCPVMDSAAGGSDLVTSRVELEAELEQLTQHTNTRVSSLQTMLRHVTEQIVELRQNGVTGLSGSSSNDDDDSSSSDAERPIPLVKCASAQECGPQPPCRVAKCIVDLPWFGLTGHCSIALADEGAACTDGSQSGTCSADGECIPGQGCVEGERFAGNWWFPEIITLVRAPITLLQIEVTSCTKDSYTLHVRRGSGLVRDFRELSQNEALLFGLPIPTTFTKQTADWATGRPTPFSSPLFALSPLAFRAQHNLFFATINGSNTPSLCDDSLGVISGVTVLDSLFACGTKLSGPVRLRPLDDDSGFPNNGDPVFLAKQFADTLGTTRLYSTDVANFEGYIGNDQLKMLPSELELAPLPIGPASLFDVYPSRGNSGVTTLLLKEYIPINPASELTLSGFTGAYSLLNGGGFRIVQATETFGQSFENVALSDAFYAQDRVLYEVVIDENTSSLPAFDSMVHGNSSDVTLSSVVPKLHSDMSYLEMMNVIFYILHKSAELGETHVKTGAYVDVTTGRIPVDFDDVQRGIQDSSVELQMFRSRTDGYQSTGLATGFVAPLFSRAVANDPFAEADIVALGTDSTRDNYLLQSSIMYPWFRFSPTSSVTTALHEKVAVVGGAIPLNAYVACTYQGLRATSTPEGASDIDVIMHPTPELGDGINSATGQPDIVVNGTFGFFSPVGLVPTDFFAGVVNPQLVGGRKIGLIRLGRTVTFEDVFLGTPFSIFPEFGVARAKQFCVMTQYLNTYVWSDQTVGVDAVIVESPANGGGLFTEEIGSCFGGQRPGTEFYTGKADQTYRPLTNDASITRPLRATTNDPFVLGTQDPTSKIIDPARIQAALPNSVFTNGTVVVITSTNSISGGDHLPWSFIGQQQDGDLGSIVPGSSVTSRLVGNLHGHLVGAAPFPFTFGQSGSNSRLRTSGGSPAPVFQFTPEGVYLNAVADTNAQLMNNRFDPVTNEPIVGLRPTSLCLSNSPLYDPSLCESDSRASGTFFRPLSSERRDVTYFDFGYNETGASIGGMLYNNGHWDSISNGGPTGLTYMTNTFGDSFPDQPLRGTSARSLASVRNSWLEEALRVAQMLQYGSIVSGPAPASAAQLVAGSAAHSQVSSLAQQAYLNKTKALHEEIENLNLENMADRMKFFDAYSQHVLGRTN